MSNVEKFAEIRSRYLKKPFDHEWVRVSKINYTKAINVVIPLTKTISAPTVINSELIPEGNGKIFVSNHVGSCDQFNIFCGLGPRPIHFLVKTKLMNVSLSEYMNLDENNLIFFIDKIGLMLLHADEKQKLALLTTLGSVLGFTLDEVNLNDSQSLKALLYDRCQKLLEFKVGKFYRAVGAIEIDENSEISKGKAFVKMIQVLLHGGNVFIFPEGTRNRSGKRLPYDQGAVKLAQLTGAPIEYFSVEDCENFRKRRAFVRYGGEMFVGPDEDLAEANQRLEALTDEGIAENDKARLRLSLNQ